MSDGKSISPSRIEAKDAYEAPPALLRPMPRVERDQVEPGQANQYFGRALVIGRLSAVAVTIVMIALLGRVVQLQVAPPKQIAEMIGTQTSKVALKGRRGHLMDRNSRIIATSGLGHSLFVDPFLIDDPNTFSETVGYTLDYDPATIEQRLFQRRNSRYVVIDKNISSRRMGMLEGFQLGGLGVRPFLERHYPQGDLAGQVIGFVGAEERGVEGRGLEGIERLFDAYLRGKPGAMTYLRDAKRQPLWVQREGYKQPMDGRSIRLSLDMTIQAIAQNALQETCEQFSAESGQLVMLDPHTGEILAMANYPTFDPNDLSQPGMRPAAWRNRCVTDVLEPGSTFKPFVWAALTDAGIGKPSEMIDCGPGYWVTPYGRRLRDASGHGRVDWMHVLIESSNIGMAKVAERTSRAGLNQMVSAFGFGRPTGSALPGEVGGILNPLRRWTKYSMSSIPMGQEIGTTPLQIAAAFCPLANGGLMVTPTIVAVHPDEPLASSPIYERILTPETAELTKNVLRRVVTEGTGRKIKSSPYGIFGKTGTAQVPNPTGRGYLPGQYIAGFVGGAPLDRPRVVVACFIQRPDKRKGYYGGLVAAPCVRKVIEQTLVYMGVEPDAAELERHRPMVVRR